MSPKDANERRRRSLPLERRRGRAPSAGETIIEAAQRHGVEIPHLCYTPGMRAGRQLPRVHGRDQGRARAGAVVLPRAGAGNGRVERQRARRARAEDDRRDARGRRAGARLQARLGAGALAALARHRQAALRGARAAGAGSLAPGDGGQPRRLHPVHALRARLPRGAGQRRHRLRVPRRAFEDRVRPRRSDGRVDVRRLRRMRAGVPDRRARAGAGRLPRADRSRGGVGVPVLRCRLPAHLPRQGQRDRPRRRPRRAGQSRAPVREGPLRLRLRASSAAPDEAADPQARHAEDRPTSSMDPANPLSVFREATWDEALDLAGGTLRGFATRTAAARSPASARPRAPTKRRTCSRSSCAPASAPTTSTIARGSATRRASRRCSRASGPARCRIR